MADDWTPVAPDDDWTPVRPAAAPPLPAGAKLDTAPGDNWQPVIPPLPNGATLDAEIDVAISAVGLIERCK